MDNDTKPHPLFGFLKGKMTIAPGADLTQPLWPEPAPTNGLRTELAATPNSEKNA